MLPRNREGESVKTQQLIPEHSENRGAHLSLNRRIGNGDYGLLLQNCHGESANLFFALALHYACAHYGISLTEKNSFITPAPFAFELPVTFSVTPASQNTGPNSALLLSCCGIVT